MNWKDNIDSLVAKIPAAEELYVPLRAGRLLRSYRRRREEYETALKAAGSVYNEAATVAAVRAGLRARGHTPVVRRKGEIHTFAFIPRISWHRHLYDELAELGPVAEFDYAASGYSVERLRRADRRSNRERDELNAMVLPAIKAAHRRRPVDWVFIYAGGSEIKPATVKAIQEEFGVPVVGMCLDDKQSWAGPRMGDHRGLQIDLAPVLDLAWTSARVACDWYLANAGRPIYMPEGCNPKRHHPLPATRDIPVSFIGGRNGPRAGAIRFLRRHGVPVQVYGRGWSAGSWVEDPLKIICRSRVNLGMGGIGYSEWLTNVKGRDFDIPCAGGGVYITSFNPDLSLHFDVGKEIVCYRSRDEMLELIRYYLAHDDEAREIARAAGARCLAEHRWLHRYLKICGMLGIIDEKAPGSSNYAESENERV